MQITRTVIASLLSRELTIPLLEVAPEDKTEVGTEVTTEKTKKADIEVKSNIRY